MEYRPGDEMSSSVKEKADNLSVHSNTPIPIPSPDEISLVRELLFIFFMALAQLFTQAGVSQTINPGSEIAETFNVQDKPGEISWFSASYSLTAVSTPIVSADAFRGETGAILGTIAAGWSSFGIWLQYSFEWSKYVDGRKPIMRAVEFIPTAFVGFLAAALTAFLLTRVPSSVVMLMAMVSFLGGIVIMGTRHVGQIYWGQKFVSLLVQCWGMDMSFPAACIILSNSLPRHQQGIAGSLVSTFVNYSISIGLGFAGTVEYYETKNKPVNEETRIYGMRRAFYMGMGLAGLGVVLSLLFLYKQIVLEPRKNRKAEQENQNSDDKLENEA
ncbi:hypothetical protein QCA50_009288 [Cerrena zonata]|uniref:Uncharacterized protein n=1 Tax=Cerrena zonata TaxID=2478898 RepID=A0AAW0G7B0_9APHY